MATGKKTGGRKKGSLNKRTRELDKLVKAGKRSPLEYMLNLMHDSNADSQRRDDMAKAAAPYVHARRAPEDKTGNTIPTIVYVHPSLEDDCSDGDTK